MNAYFHYKHIYDSNARLCIDTLAEAAILVNSFAQVWKRKFQQLKVQSQTKGVL